jgi:hypothetical protein
MKESYRKGVANHPDPESCVVSQEASHRSVDRGIDGPGDRAVKEKLRDAQPVTNGEGNTDGGAHASRRTARAVKEPRHV